MWSCRAVVLLSVFVLWPNLPASCNLCVNNISESTGFTSTSDIYSLEETDFTLLPTKVSQSNSEIITFRRWLFHNTLVFNCTGNLSGWIFRGESVRNVGTITNLPLLQVYHETTGFLNQPRYDIRPGSEAVPSVSNRSTNGVYEYTLPSPVEVQEGDVVMIQYQQSPQLDTNFLQMAFSDNATDGVSRRDMRGGTFFEITDTVFQQDDDQYVPILTALMGGTSLVLPVPSTSFLSSTIRMPQSSLQVSPSPTTLHVTHDMHLSTNYYSETPPMIMSPPSMDRSLVMFGLGVIVGLFSALLFTSIVVIVTLLVCKVKKLHCVNRKSPKEFTLSEEYAGDPHTGQISSVILPNINEAYSSLLLEGKKVPPSVNSENDDMSTEANAAYAVSTKETVISSTVNAEGDFISTEANAAYVTSTMETVYEECNPDPCNHDDDCISVPKHTEDYTYVDVKNQPSDFNSTNY